MYNRRRELLVPHIHMHAKTLATHHKQYVILHGMIKDNHIYTGYNHSVILTVREETVL